MTIPKRFRVSRRAVLAILLGAALPAAATAAGSGRREFDRVFKKTLPLASGQKLSIEHRNGDLRIETGREPQVVIEAAIHVSSSDEEGARRFANEIEIDAREVPGGVSVRTRYPERKWTLEGHGDVSIAVDYRIRMPEGANLEAENRFGNTWVSGIKGSAAVRNTNGTITLRDGKGKQRLENTFGTVDVSGNDGDVTIVNSNGAVAVRGITGSLDVQDRFGRVEVSKVSRRCAVNNSNGEVRVSEAGGPVEVTSSFGTVELSAIQGDVSVVSANGRVIARDIRGKARLETRFGAIDASAIAGDVTASNGNSPITLADIEGAADVRGSHGDIRLLRVKKGARVSCGNGRVSLADVGAAAYVKTSFGLVDAARIGGDLTVESANGAVRVSDVKGGASVRTSFGPVSLQGVEGPVDVDNQNGSIEVLRSGAAKGCRNISLKTSFAAIRFFPPENAGYSINARTSFGKIRSDFPVAPAEGLSESSLRGKIGDGRCELTLTNANGSIELLKPR
jgi:DUF4097 and DUF4098 domain-containing protein YvlB